MLRLDDVQSDYRPLAVGKDTNPFKTSLQVTQEDRQTLPKACRGGQRRIFTGKIQDDVGQYVQDDRKWCNEECENRNCSRCGHRVHKDHMFDGFWRYISRLRRLEGKDHRDCRQRHNDRHRGEQEQQPILGEATGSLRITCSSPAIEPASKGAQHSDPGRHSRSYPLHPHDIVEQIRQER